MILETIIITVYSVALILIFLYALAQLNLLLNYLRARKKDDDAPKFNLSDPGETPVVTIQLPVYNELYVMERLLNCMAEIDYPKDKLEVQVLDDSTDESFETTAAQIKKLRETGLDIKHVTRENREGFKAGALKEGLKTARGEFIAIFDADFLPTKSWLQRTIPYFKNPDIGVVQTRWGHINRNYSLLTKMQAFALDAHFTIEQVGRNSNDHFINFNGTAGVWRKECIEDAGNWQSDTLTEDLDLSYRSQLKGWKFKYLEDVETPAELPVVISAARSQQFRWNKGGAENFRKMNRRLMSDKDTSLKTRIHGFIHLLNSSMFLSIFIVAVLSIPMLYIKDFRPEYKYFFQFTSLFVVSTFIFFACYWVAYKRIHGKGIRTFAHYVRDFFFFFSVAMGFSLHNSLAVLEGHIGKKSAFIRTPKFNVTTLKDSWKNNKYLQGKLSTINFIEGFLVLYFLFGIISAFKLTDYGLLPFHLMLFFGFGFVFYKSITCRI